MAVSQNEGVEFIRATLATDGATREEKLQKKFQLYRVRSERT
jgi:hypothetical protein